MTGDIVYARFPFADKIGYKSRPAVVLVETKGRVVCAAVTTRKYNGSAAVKINDWKRAGLAKPSTVRVDVVSTFTTKFVCKIGRLKQDDYRRIIDAFNKVINRSNACTGS